MALKKGVTRSDLQDFSEYKLKGGLGESRETCKETTVITIADAQHISVHE